MFFASPVRPCRWREQLCFAAVFFSLLCSGAQAGEAREQQLKAAFLYNFARFVEWPPQSIPESENRFVIGLLAGSGFADELRTVIGERKINGRAVLVRSFSEPPLAGTVHILYIAEAEAQRLDARLAGIHQQHMLTVGECDRFAAAQGIITFIREADKLRFVINVRAANHAGLRISAQLLKLAKEVHR